MMEPGKQPPYRVFSAFSGVDQSMELDTGASKTVISEVYKTLYVNLILGWNLNLHVQNCVLTLGNLFPVQLIVNYKNKQYDLKAEVVKGKTPCLLGRDWLDVIKLCWDEVFQIKIEVHSDVEQILQKYEVVFKKGLGTVQRV